MTTVDEILEQAMKLNEEQRRELSDRLFQSTLPEVPGEPISSEELERSWGEEIKRRLEEIDNGEVELKDAFEALEEGRRKLREGRGK